MIGIARTTPASGIVMDTVNPLMGMFAQRSPPQIAAAVRAAGENAYNIAAIDSDDEGRFLGVVRSNSDRTQTSDLQTTQFRRKNTAV